MEIVKSVAVTVLKVCAQLSIRGHVVVGNKEKDVEPIISAMNISVGGLSLYFLCK